MFYVTIYRLVSPAVAVPGSGKWGAVGMAISNHVGQPFVAMYVVLSIESQSGATGGQALNRACRSSRLRCGAATEYRR